MFGDLDALFYFDELLIRQLGSFVIEGYIDIVTHRDIRDKTLTGMTNIENREGCFTEKRWTKDEREGFKNKICNDNENIQRSSDNKTGIEDREYIRREDEVKRIYTSFNVYKNFYNTISSTNRFRNITERDILNNTLKEGEIVGVECSLDDNCPYKCIETIVDILNALGKDLILKILEKKNIPLGEDFNIDKIFALLNLINDKLSKDGNKDIIMKVGNTPIIICVNANCFCNTRDNMIRGSGCNLKIIGKVVKNCNGNKGINLFRKLGECSFYGDMLRDLMVDVEIINKCNLHLPTKIEYDIKDVGTMILPISIFS